MRRDRAAAPCQATTTPPHPVEVPRQPVSVVLSGGRLVADASPDEALTDALLARIFGVTAKRGAAADGTRYILPWAKVPLERGGER